MKINFSNRIFRILIAASLFFSCASDLDFNQTKDLRLEPVIVANFAYFDLPVSDFGYGGSGEIAFDAKEFEVFKEQFLKDNLVKADIDFELENTIPRAFTIDIQLLDANGQILEILTFSLPAYSGGTNIVKYPTEVFQNQRLDLLKQTAQVGFVVRMLPGTPLDQNSTGNIKLRSGGTVYFEIQ